jgi:hypothetical protein
VQHLHGSYSRAGRCVCHVWHSLRVRRPRQSAAVCCSEHSQANIPPPPVSIPAVPMIDIPTIDQTQQPAKVYNHDL